MLDEEQETHQVDNVATQE